MAGLRAALLLSCLVPGCAAGPDEAAVTAMHQALAMTRASLATVAPGPAAAPSPAPPPAQAATSRLPAGPRLRGAGAPRATGALVGMPAAEARRMLGEPSLRRAEGEAEIWLYEVAECRLDLVLYPERGALVEPR